MAAQPQEAVEPEASRPSILVFFSTTSGASRRLDGFLAQVLQRRHNHTTFRVHRIDVDLRPDLLARFHVTDTPTLLVVVGGSIRGRLSRPSGCAEIHELLAPWLK